MKIRFCTFSLAKYGGIIQHIETKFEALKKQGHDVDIIILDYKTSLSLPNYTKKVKSLEDESFQRKLEVKSQNGGYSRSEITGYWSNPYYGWLLEPYKNVFPALDKNSVEAFKKSVEDVDLIIWSFVPTKTSAAKGFNWWHEYFDLPKSTKQVLTIHDGYYDLRNSWTNFLKKKISFMECVHITGYQACEVFDIPRFLNLDSRKLPTKLKVKSKEARQVDFFSAHIWKSMKRMEDLLTAIPYVKKGRTCFVAGSGIELYYMMTEDKSKQKPKYTVSKKTDPDCKEDEIGLSIFQRAEKYGMEYLGVINNEEINYLLQNSKFAIDPSFCSHYAKYVNVHLNGFIIEAIANGCYPILRNYRKDEIENDFIFKNLKAIYIPYDVTPKDFAMYLNKAMSMTESQYLKDTLHNFKLAKSILDPDANMKQIIGFIKKPKRIKRELDKGQSTPKIQKDSMEVMTKFFGYKELPDLMK